MEYEYNNTKAFRATDTLWYILILVEILLGLRLLLKLFSANVYGLFTQFIYIVSYPLVTPFLYIVNSTKFDAHIIEWSAVIAMSVYWIVAWAFVELVTLFKQGAPQEQTYVRQARVLRIRDIRDVKPI